MKTILSLLSCLALLLPALGEEQSSKELLRDGLFEEEVNQDFKKAKAAYQNVTRRYDEERFFAGLAFFRLAEIARKSGDQKQAVALYRRVAGEFADQKEIAKRALEQLGDAGPDDKRMAFANLTKTPSSNAEALELQRLQKMERDSPDLLNGVGEDGWHPIHKAAANGWTSAIDYLLARKVKVDPRATVKADYKTEGYTPLHLAVIHGHLTVVDRLLAAKADPSLVVYIKPEDLPLPVQAKSIPLDGWGDWSSLHFSILFQRQEIMIRLLNAKAPLAAGGPLVGIYKTTSSSRPGVGSSSRNWNFIATPLILAVWLNDMIAFKNLIDHGADMNQAASETGETPLLAAIWQNSGLVPTLIDQGAQVTDDFVFGRSLLHWAIIKCQPPTILRLIKEGADVNIRVKMNQYSSENYPTPLEAAMRRDLNDKQRAAVCDALLKAGARPTPRALSKVTAYGQFKTMAAFLKAGVDPNGSNEDGNRPLHYVKNVKAAQILIEAGAQLEVKNHEGLTPFGNIIDQDDTPQSRALIDYLLEKGADTSVIPPLLFSTKSTLGDRPLIPYVMSKTVLVGKSNPKAIMLAFPRHWKVAVGADQILPGTPAPSLQELLSLNYLTLSENRANASRNSPRRASTKAYSPSSNPPVVTDLVIYRPNEKGELVEIAQLANLETAHKPAPALKWGDIILARIGPKENDKQQMPLVHYVSGLEARTITFKVGPWENKVSIENTHLGTPGLELQDHFSPNVEVVDLSKIVLRRANGESKTINLTLTHDSKKIRLMEGDVIEYSLKEQFNWSKADPLFAQAIQVFFPDRPARTQSDRRIKEITLSEALNDFPLARGRDFSKLTIQRMGDNELERIPLDLLAATHSLSNGEAAMAKTLELLKTKLFPGDILVFPPKDNVSWQKRSEYTSATGDSEIGSLVGLVKPTPPPRPGIPTNTRATPSKKPSTRTNKPRVVLPPPSK